MAPTDATPQQQPPAVAELPVVAADTPATTIAAVASTKRIAKKLKKKLSPDVRGAGRSSDDGADDDENANNIATVDHPYLSFLHKRIRLYKKKLEKIKTLEAAQSVDGKVLNGQQLELVASKSAMEKIVSEFESLREQFIGVYLQEEAAKKAAQEKQAADAAAAAASAAAAVETLVEVIVDETVAELAGQSTGAATIEPPATIDTLPATNDAFEYVRDLLKTLHVVNLHQALGKDVPMVLDFFAKVLLGNTRPVAEVPFDENLAESLAEARKYLTRSDKIMACGATYRDLRETVDTLAQMDVLAEVVGSAGDTNQSVADALPQINFFTDSLLDDTSVADMPSDLIDDSTDDKSDEHANAPEEIDDVVDVVVENDDDDAVAAEQQQQQLVDELVRDAVVETLAPSPASIPAPPMSFAAVAAAAPANPPTAWATKPQQQPTTTTAVTDAVSAGERSSSSQRRRPQSGDKPRRPRPQRSGDESYTARTSNSGSSHSSSYAHPRSSGTGSKDERRPRVDRSLRKHGSNIHQPQAHASPQA